MAEGKRPSLTAEERSERGTRAVRRLRRSGFVPGVVYGGSDGDSVSFKADARALRQLLSDGSALMDVKIGGGQARPVIVKDQQFHPVREELLHIDLLEVRLDEKIHTTLAIEITGVEEAPGVKEGGVLEHVTRELNIEALPTDIPDNITVDVSGMEIAATLTLAELETPPGVVFLHDNPEEVTIATVVVPTEIEEPEEIEEETELVGEEGELPEGEEAPAEEGEAPAEGEGEPERAEGEEPS
jgi:large subunit ribosomal protein L25